MKSKINKNRQHFETASYHLIAAGTTEKLIEERLNIPVKKLLSNLSGSHQQISSLIVQGEVDVLIFFWAPMKTQPHALDIMPCCTSASVKTSLLRN